MENGYIESFNGRMRDECLNVHVFFTLVSVSEKFELWREGYNQVRPHSALEDRSPKAFAASWNRKSAVARNAAPAKKCASARGALHFGVGSKTRTAFRPALSSGGGQRRKASNR